MRICECKLFGTLGVVHEALTLPGSFFNFKRCFSLEEHVILHETMAKYKLFVLLAILSRVNGIEDYSSAKKARERRQFSLFSVVTFPNE